MQTSICGNFSLQCTGFSTRLNNSRGSSCFSTIPESFVKEVGQSHFSILVVFFFPSKPLPPPPPPPPPPTPMQVPGSLLFLHLHLDPAEYQVAIRWWLSLDSPVVPCTPFALVLPLIHLVTMLPPAAMVEMFVARHNHLRDIFADFCCHAPLPVKIKVGYGICRDMSTAALDRGKPAVLDITVTSSLTPVTLSEASVAVGAAAFAAESRKHAANDAKCQELGWSCIPMPSRHMAIGGKRLRVCSPT